MIGKLRRRVERLGVVVTFLAALFAASPSLQAAACAAEGCGVACLTGAAEASHDNSTGSGSGGCNESNCIGAAAHHHGVANLSEASDTLPTVEADHPHFAMVSEPVASGVSPGLERPPRV